MLLGIIGRIIITNRLTNNLTMAKYTTDKKRVVTYFTAPIEEMSQKLIEEKGYINHQDVILHAVRLLYADTYKASYLQKIPSARLSRTPEQRAQDDIDAKQSLADKKKEASYAMCHALGGEIKGGACHYRTFTKAYGTKVHAGASSISLETISDETIQNQFINTTREEAQAQGLL